MGAEDYARGKPAPTPICWPWTGWSRRHPGRCIVVEDATGDHVGPRRGRSRDRGSGRQLRWIDLSGADVVVTR